MDKEDIFEIYDKAMKKQLWKLFLVFSAWKKIFSSINKYNLKNWDYIKYL